MCATVAEKSVWKPQFLFCFLFSGVFLTMLSVWRPYSVDDGMVHGYGAVDGMRIDRGNGSTRIKPTPVPLVHHRSYIV
jgi:hypothetical protein